jgi:hypothetical protein
MSSHHLDGAGRHHMGADGQHPARVCVGGKGKTEDAHRLIPIDAIYSPVKKSLRVQPTVRSGAGYRLTMKIERMSLTPDDAVAHFARAHPSGPAGHFRQLRWRARIASVRTMTVSSSTNIK